LKEIIRFENREEILVTAPGNHLRRNCSENVIRNPVYASAYFTSISHQ